MAKVNSGIFTILLADFTLALPAVDAAMSAARDRFRPILMTAFSFILGVLPLLVASGAGAEARKVMGMTVFSGMLAATVLGVLVIPALYVLVERMSGRKGNVPESGQGPDDPAGPVTEPRG